MSNQRDHHDRAGQIGNLLIGNLSATWATWRRRRCSLAACSCRTLRRLRRCLRPLCHVLRHCCLVSAANVAAATCSVAAVGQCVVSAAVVVVSAAVAADGH